MMSAPKDVLAPNDSALGVSIRPVHGSWFMV